MTQPSTSKPDSGRGPPVPAWPTLLCVLVQSLAVGGGCVYAAPRIATGGDVDLTLPPSSYRLPIVANFQSLGLSEDLDSFPLLVSLANHPALKNAAAGGRVQRLDGGDLAFSATPGCDLRLDFELDEYDATAGSLSAWVRLPLLHAAGDTSLWLCFGNADAVSAARPGALWQAASYAAVWHFAESGGDGAFVRDSTDSAIHGTPTAYCHTAAGKVGGAACFQQDSENRIEFEGAAALLDGWSAFTLELWLYPAFATDNEWKQAEWPLLDKPGTMSGGRIFIPTGADPGMGIFQIDMQFVHAPTAYAGLGVQRAAWNHVVWTYDGSSLLGYGGGLPEWMDTFASPLDSGGQPLSIGATASYPQAMAGNIDELRVSRVARSAGWVAATFANQNAPASVLTVGAVETVQR